MTVRPNNAAYRRAILWIAAMSHRVSGVLLACFLPLHFLALGLAIEGEARLEGFLRWTDSPIVKVAEMGLVFLLTVHLLGGLRLLVIENMPWRDDQKRRAAFVLVTGSLVAAFFLTRAI